MLTCGVEKVPRGRRLWLTPQLDRSKGRVLARPRDPWARLQFGMIVRLPLPARGAASPMSSREKRSYGDPLVKIQNRGQGVVEDGGHGGDPARFPREKFSGAPS